MKKTIAIAQLLVLLIAGCATTSIKGDDSINPVGYVSIYANDELGWSGESQNNGGGLLSIALKAASNKTGTDNPLIEGTRELLSQANDILNKKLEISGRTIIDKDTLLGSGTYQSADDESLLPVGTVTMDGYKFIATNNKKFEKAISEETGINGQLFMGFDFEKIMLTGIAKNGEMGAAVTLNVMMVSPKGKLLWHGTFFAQSEESIPVVLEVYDRDALYAMFPAVIESVCSDFAAEL